MSCDVLPSFEFVRDLGRCDVGIKYAASQKQVTESLD